MRTTLLGVLMVYLAIGISFAQGGKAVFEKTEHDFGTVKQEDGDVRVDFVYKNVGSKPLKLKDVKPSCGCTIPEWTSDPVPPKGKAFIKVRYDASHRPGELEKGITVITDGEPEVTYLKIKGKVLPKPKSWKDDYSNNAGIFKVKQKLISLGKVKNDEKKTGYVTLLNPTENDITLEIDKGKYPDYLKVSASSAVVKAGDTCQVRVEIDGAKKNDWGVFYEAFKVKTSHEFTPELTMMYTGQLVENFGDLPLDGKYPSVQLDRAAHKFGKVVPDSIYTTQFTLTNKGESELIVRQVKASCGCTLGKLSKDRLQPGESTVLDVTFNTKGLLGLNNKNITIIANDPKQPETIIRLFSFVKP